MVQNGLNASGGITLANKYPWSFIVRRNS